MTISLKTETNGGKHRISFKALTVIAIASMMALGGLAVLAYTDDSSAEEVTVNGLKFEKRTITAHGDKAVLVKLVDKSLEDVTIPGKVDFSGVLYDVYSVDQYAFRDCTNLKTVYMADNIEAIELQAFSGCSSLMSIRFSSSLRYIEALAFSGCSSLDNLKFPASLYHIGYRTFESCTSISKLEIPKTIENIDDTAFSFCTSLKAFDVAEDSPYFSSVDGVLYNKDKTELRICPAGINSCVVSKDVKTIGHAFSGDKLNTVDFAGDCKATIKGGAFNGCSSLTIVIRSGADPVFEEGSIIFTDMEKHTITVRSADSFVIPEIAYNANYVSIDYKGLDDGTDIVWYIVGGIILFLIIAGAVVFTLIKRR